MICDELYESKNTNVFYSIFSFKWDPWWCTFVSQFLVYMISALGLQDFFIGLTWFLHWIYMIPSLSLQDSCIVFTGFLNRVYRIHSECGFTGFLPMIWFTWFIVWVYRILITWILYLRFIWIFVFRWSDMGLFLWNVKNVPDNMNTTHRF